MDGSVAVRNFINGRYAEPATDRSADLVDPCTGEAFATAPLSGPADVDAAMRAAADAFERWRDTPPGQRQRALLRLADAIEARADLLLDAECRTTGKPRGAAAAEEVLPSADQLRFFAGAARLLEGRAAGSYLDGHESYVRREPVGVCAQVTPWNYPLQMAVWKIGPALAAGNTVVLKPAETTPLSTLLLAEFAAEYFPPGVVNVVCGGRDTGRLLVTHPVPQLVSVTGSVRAGREVAAAAAQTLKRVQLELGGNAPVVVFDDADVDVAAAQIAGAGYFNAGQDCTAAARVLAGPGVYDRLVTALTARAKGTSTGAPVDDKDFGPLNNADQFARVTALVERVGAHATVHTGGAPVGERGFFYAPTVVGGVRQDDEIVQQEIFGPVITVQRFTDEDEAVRWANGVPHGLAASVWTADHGRALRMTRRLDVGCVWVNTHAALAAEMPHGGFKQSGYGKDLSVYSLDDYSRVKHVTHAVGR